MANNLPVGITDAEWEALAKEASEAEIEIYVLRKDKQALLVERELPVPSPYVSALVAALLHLDKTAITKITIYVDGDSLK